MSPYFALLGDYVTNLHLILFGCLALTAGIANLKLPETLGKPLPEDMQDLLNLLGDRKRRAGKKTTRSRTTSNTSDNQQYTLLSLEDASDSD